MRHDPQTQPARCAIAADTGYSAWFYTARLKNLPWVFWGFNDAPGRYFTNLRWKLGCKEGTRDCYTWGQAS